MINITARGFELKQGAKDGIEKELKRIEKMLPDNASFDATLKTGKELPDFLKKKKTAISAISP